MSEAFQTANINELAERTYQFIARASEGLYDPEDVHRSEVCLTASDIMLRSMLKEGKTQDEIDLVERISSRLEARHHIYLVDKTSGQEEIIDPTWQQFVTKSSNGDLPKVLMGAREQVIAQAKEAGIEDEAVLDLWRPLEDAKTITAEKWRNRLHKPA